MEFDDLLNRLKFETNVFKGGGIEEAFRAIDRQDFLEEDYKSEAYEDYAVPLPYGASLTQPTTLAFMLELLEVQPGNSILDVGSGSGFSTALLSKLTGKEGSVLGLEIIPELLDQSKKNIEKYNLKNINIEKGESERLLDKKTCFDRIMVNASADKMPLYLFNQLVLGGKMVVPIGDTLMALKKTSQHQWEEKSFDGFVFVPLQ